MKELWYERRYAQQKHRDERDRDVVLAWHVMRIKVMTQNAKRLPQLKTLLDEGRGTTATPAGQKAALYQLSARLGIPVIRRARE